MEFNATITKWYEFWDRVNNGVWEPSTFEIFDRFVSSDRCFLDVGCWIGPTALYAAQIAKHTYAFEPDPIAFQELAANVRANQGEDWARKLTIYNSAIATTSGVVRLGSRGSGGDSTSSALFADGNVTWDVRATTLGEFLGAAGLEREKLFIKMDIEGGEYDLLPTLTPLLRRLDVVLFLSIHPEFLKAGLGSSRSLVGRIVRRWRFASSQARLLRALPFRRLYHSDGRPVGRSAAVLRSLVRGSFIHELVATNRSWEEP